MQRDITSDTNHSPSKYPVVARLGAMQQQQEATSTNACQDEQPRSTVGKPGDTFHAEQDATNLTKGQNSEDDQVHVEAATSSYGAPLRSNGSGRTRMSITSLIAIDGITMDSESKKTVVKKARMAEQAFSERVDQLEAATVTAHKQYWDRLRHVYSASIAKKMRLASAEPLRTTLTTQPRNDHEALDALVMAAASGARHANKQATSTEFAAMRVKKAKRTYSRPHNSLLLGNRASNAAADTERNPVQVHDPTLAQAVDKLTNKSMQLLTQLEAASDAAAIESMMAAAATIASEVTEMGRCDEVALARIMEIEEHRVQVMQGLLGYTRRKEERRNDEEEKGSNAH